MKKILLFLFFSALFSCSQNNGDVDALDGVYLLEFPDGENFSLVINEYKKGKLGYDIMNYPLPEDESYSSITGIMSIKVFGKDSMAHFTPKMLHLHKRKYSFVNILNDKAYKIRFSKDTLYVNELPFVKQELKGDFKQLKIAAMVVMESYEKFHDNDNKE